MQERDTAIQDAISWRESNVYISLIEIDSGQQTILETLDDTESNRLKLHKQRFKLIDEGKDIQFVCSSKRPEYKIIPRKQRRAQERYIQNILGRKVK